MSERKTIYLDDAIDLVKYRMKHNPMKSVEFIQGLQDGYLRVLSDLERLPSAERKGKWIECDDSWDGVYYECSECKEAFTLIDGTPSDNLYNFCPNCGSRNEVNE